MTIGFILASSSLLLIPTHAEINAFFLSSYMTELGDNVLVQRPSLIVEPGYIISGYVNLNKNLNNLGMCT